MCGIYYHKQSGIYSDILSSVFSLASILKLYLAFVQACKSYIVCIRLSSIPAWIYPIFLAATKYGIFSGILSDFFLHSFWHSFRICNSSYSKCEQKEIELPVGVLLFLSPIQRRVNDASMVCAVGRLGFWGEIAAHMLDFAVRSGSVDTASYDKLGEGWWGSQEGSKEGRSYIRIKIYRQSPSNGRRSFQSFSRTC